MVGFPLHLGGPPCTSDFLFGLGYTSYEFAYFALASMNAVAADAEKSHQQVADKPTSLLVQSGVNDIHRFSLTGEHATITFVFLQDQQQKHNI